MTEPRTKSRVGILPIILGLGLLGLAGFLIYSFIKSKSKPKPKSLASDLNLSGDVNSDSNGDSNSNTPVLKDVNKSVSNNNNNNNLSPVIIVGGGVTGLLIAHQLNKYQIPFIILESSPQLGGRIGTIRYSDGGTSEAPLEEYWKNNPIVPILKNLGLDLHEDNAHSSTLIDRRIHLARGDPNWSQYVDQLTNSLEDINKFEAWNQKMWNLYKQIQQTFLNKNVGPAWPKDEVKRYGWNVDAVLTPCLSKLKDITFADFVKAERLPRVFEEWIRITLEPEIAIEWDKITALDGIDEFRIFLKNPEGFGESNYHIKGGNGQLIDALVKSLPSSSIKLNCHVTKIEQLLLNNPQGAYDPITKTTYAYGRKVGDIANVEVSYLENDSKTDSKHVKILKADKCITTIPVCDLHNIRFTPALPPLKQLAIDTSRFGSYIKIHIRLDSRAQGLWSKYDVDNDAANININTRVNNNIGCYKSNNANANVKVNTDSKETSNSLFTFLTDDVIGSLYDATNYDHPSSRSTFNLTCLLHGTRAKEIIRDLNDAEIEELVKNRLEILFPGITSYIKEIEIFTFEKAVAHWPAQLKRSRFDDIAQELRRPFGNVYIGGDSTFNSHSEGAGLSAQYIVDSLISKMNLK